MHIIRLVILLLFPAYFNPYRAGGKTKDYWDKSLKLLRQKEESWTYKNHEIEWDEKNFIRYVNLFFLWDYLDQDGEILEIYESDNLLSYFEKVPRFIYRRGIFICAMLKVNELSTEYYAEMQNKIFNSCEAIGGYREVFEKIEKLECYKFVKEIFDSDEVKSLL